MTVMEANQERLQALALRVGPSLVFVSDEFEALMHVPAPPVWELGVRGRLRAMVPTMGVNEEFACCTVCSERVRLRRDGLVRAHRRKAGWDGRKAVRWVSCVGAGVPARVGVIVTADRSMVIHEVVLVTAVSADRPLLGSTLAPLALAAGDTVNLNLSRFEMEV